MWIGYLIAFIPLVIGAIWWMLDEDIVWYEWIGSFIIALIVVAIFNFTVVTSMTTDVEMWSGRIVKACYQPEWVEEYEEEHIITDDDGDVISRWYTTEHCTHAARWYAVGDFGARSQTYYIRPEDYRRIVKMFGGECRKRVWRDGWDAEQSNPDSIYDYYAVNKNNFIVPVNATYSFENRLKASPTLYSFVRVPKGTKGLYEWPVSEYAFESRRLLGLAKKDIDIFKFDQMCSRLGPLKKVNVIVIGWDAAKYDSLIAQYQEARWYGGKKTTWSSATVAIPMVLLNGPTCLGGRSGLMLRLISKLS